MRRELEMGKGIVKRSHTSVLIPCFDQMPKKNKNWVTCSFAFMVLSGGAAWQVPVLVDMGHEQRGDRRGIVLREWGTGLGGKGKRRRNDCPFVACVGIFF